MHLFQCILQYKSGYLLCARLGSLSFPSFLSFEGQENARFQILRNLVFYLCFFECIHLGWFQMYNTSIEGSIMTTSKITQSSSPRGVFLFTV